MRRISLLLFGLMAICELFSQSGEKMPFTENDTIPQKPIVFTASSASEFIHDLLKMENLWGPAGDTMKLSLERLIYHFNEPFDSVGNRLFRFNYDSISLEHIELVHKDTIPLRWLNDSTFIIDTIALEKEPFIIQTTIIKKSIDASGFVIENNYPDMETLIDYMLQDNDTITEMIIDTVFLESKGIQLYKKTNNRIQPPLLPRRSSKSATFLPDSGKIVFSESTKVIVANTESPFYIVPNEQLPDSLRIAVETLLNYTTNRDSVKLYVNDISGNRTTFWLNTGNADLNRFWVKNFKNDSISLWVGNPAKNNLTLILEEDININRMKKETIDDIAITMARPERSLAKVEPLKAIPVYWAYKFSSSLSLNQTYLSNWSKGGENSLSSVLDIIGSAKYTDTEAKTQWTNSGRLKYGNIITEEYGLRTNTDMFELNSQYNKVIKNKVDFSAIFYMKSQIARGYKYPNDSVVVSKFLNPGTFTIGAGFEYKPFKQTSLNYSILSYKNTFVLDTANINQTAHGIAKDKRSKQEMGGQLMIKNSMTILDDLSMTNSVRLFSGYLNKPQNIDVDWELSVEKRINWYFTILLNLHMIYDDDIRFPVMDENDKPVKLEDGSIKKVPKMQFKEFMGLTLSFKF